MMKRVLELLFPSKCLLCRKILAKDEMDLCHACRAQVEEQGNCRDKIQFLDSWTALWHYGDMVRGCVLRYKFYGRRHYASGFGRLLAMKIQRQEIGFDVLTWVPISRRRRMRRGYDQVELLTKAVGKELGIKAVRCLKRVRHDPPQSGIKGAAQRRANVLGAYKAVHPERFAGKRVLILDDVITTGATVGECARMLLTAGAKAVHGAALASARDKKT